MKHLPWALIIIGAIAVYLLWPEPEDLSGFEHREKLREAHVHSLQQDYEKLKARLKADSVVYSTTIQTYKDKDKKNLAYIENLKAKPTVVKVVQETPELDALLQAYDSLLQSKDSQLQLQSEYIATLQVDLGKVTENFLERLAIQDSMIQDQKGVIQDQRKQLRKERCRSRVARVLVPVALGLGLLVGL